MIGTPWPSRGCSWRPKNGRTILNREVVDQPHLFGILDRVNSLGLALAKRAGPASRGQRERGTGTGAKALSTCSSGSGNAYSLKCLEEVFSEVVRSPQATPKIAHGRMRLMDANGSVDCTLELL